MHDSSFVEHFSFLVFNKNQGHFSSGYCITYNFFFSQDTVMLGADFYETDEEMATLLAEGKVPLGIGENTRIKYKLHLKFSI